MAFMSRNLIADCGLRIAESAATRPIRNPQSEIRNMIHPQTRIGHVHLTVADLDRALAFYRDVLGFEITLKYGADAVFLSAGGYHHHIGLNTWAGRGAPAPPPGTTGCTGSRFSQRVSMAGRFASSKAETAITVEACVRSPAMALSYVSDWE